MAVTGLGLEGCVAIITGAGGGLGRAFAEGFAAAGAKVVASDIAEAGAHETAALIGDNAIGVKVDVTDAAALET
jgi:NAD(P)-dependent dehydrogenase (short-subunit alcohol dehydrogenase family)